MISRYLILSAALFGAAANAGNSTVDAAIGGGLGGAAGAAIGNEVGGREGARGLGRVRLEGTQRAEPGQRNEHLPTSQAGNRARNRGEQGTGLRGQRRDQATSGDRQGERGDDRTDARDPRAVGSDL